MTNTKILQCDGCGQMASEEHIAKRLQRLEWTTRYRPVHIGTLLLGAVSPIKEAEFLYNATKDANPFSGEAGQILQAAGIATEGKSREAALTALQRGGFLLIHVLECPAENSVGEQSTVERLLGERLPQTLARIRRSLKPKRIAVISRTLDPFVERLRQAGEEIPLLLDHGKAFALDEDSPDGGVLRLREAMTANFAGSR